mmetsp:Transcript_7494/g.11932  ORF Transcript_7494/g.11932 Transcript_7494/m.11932 type:complete len:284 (+) Transcript_7494:1618-2469(+)
MHDILCAFTSSLPLVLCRESNTFTTIHAVLLRAVKSDGSRRGHAFFRSSSGPLQKTRREGFVSCRFFRRSIFAVASPQHDEVVYNDSKIEKLFISIFRKSIRAELAGNQSMLDGYSGMVEECRELVLQRHNKPEAQREAVRRILTALFGGPGGVQAIASLFRALPSDLSSRLNALVTPLVFSWLVGPASVNDSPEGGYGVKIERCRFLEESGCKAMCTNMCKVPTERFFNRQLMTPLRMTPDFNDNSCQMSYGIPPLQEDQDPALIDKGCLQGCLTRKRLNET